VLKWGPDGLIVIASPDRTIGLDAIGKSSGKNGSRNAAAQISDEFR
jgi:hypothetical protein